MTHESDALAGVTATTRPTRALPQQVMLTVGLIAAALVCLAYDPAGTLQPSGNTWWVFIAVAVAYGFAERFAFHIEFRREGMSFALSEVPSVFALLLLGPIPTIGARIIGSMSVIVFSYRPPPIKVAVNSALFAFETALMFAIVKLVAGPTPIGDGRFLLAATLALTVTPLASSLIVPIAISAVEGRYLSLVASSIRTGAIVAPIASTVAVVAAAPALLSMRYAPLSLVPVGAVWLVLRSHGQLSERHRNLNAIHDFTRRVGESIRLTEVVPLALDEAMQLFRASHGIIQLESIVSTDGEASLTCIALPNRTARIITLADGSIPDQGPEFDLLIAANASRTEPTGGPGHSQLVLPLEDRRGRIGVLALTHRVGATGTFDDDDLHRFERLAEQLTTHLRNVLMHAQAERDALRDGLTGNLNRIAFDRLVTAATRTRRASTCSAVLMLDLDRFKEVNDTLGHGAGDVVLIEFARRLQSILRPDDELARFGGDEYAIFAQRTDITEVESLARDAVEQSRIPFKLDGFNVVVTASVGIANMLAADRHAEDVIRRADIAMYAAKRQHAGYETYRQELDRRTPERLSLLGDLRAALDAHALEVHYQPKLDLTTSTVVGVEALARWQHPVRGWISPEEFIRVAEETGLIKDVTDQVLSIATRDARAWRDAGFDLGVAVNLSTLDLLDERLAERISIRLQEHGLEAGRLTLEITESSLMIDTPRTMSTIQRLSDLGVSLSLDDFGTGYSSLSYLRRLPVTELKIDRSFVSNLILNEQDEAIVTSTIMLGHSLGLRIVAEGVECAEISDRLAALSCDLAQGFGISRPLSAPMFAQWMESTEHSIRRTPRRGLAIA